MKNDIEINELLSKFFNGECTPEEAMMLEDWKDALPYNEELYYRAAKIIGVPIHISENKSTGIAWENIANKIDTPEKGKKVKPMRLWLTVAASVAIILIAFFINRYRTDDFLVYAALSGPKNVRLSDATNITLLSNSVITLDKEFGKSNRQLKLSGSGSFSVKHDDAKPFVIAIDNFYIKDLGTKFRIQSSVNSDTIYLSVQEGEVMAYDNLGSSVNLTASQSAYYIRSAIEFIK